MNEDVSCNIRQKGAPNGVYNTYRFLIEIRDFDRVTPIK